MSKYPSKQNRELIHAVSLLRNEGEIIGFLRDLLTPAEIDEFSRRFQIAKLLWTTDLSYIDIAKKAETVIRFQPLRVVELKRQTELPWALHMEMEKIFGKKNMQILLFLAA